MIAPKIDGEKLPDSPTPTDATGSYFWLKAPNGRDLVAVQYVGDEVHLQIFDAQGRERLLVTRSLTAAEMTVALLNEAGVQITEASF